jgi:hypothetical protein
MTALADLARLIRSKNAGPFQLTFDIMFEDELRYRRVKDSDAITPQVVAARFGLDAEKIALFFCDSARAIKISFARPTAQGDLEDSDGHGGQQYAPLMDIDVP